MPTPLPLLYKILLSNVKRLEQPYKINFACTYSCNLKCRSCYIWKKKPRNELTRQEIGKIFSSMNPEWINLTGGEPFMRDDLPGIAGTIKDEADPYVMNITTNGFLTEKITRDVKEILGLGIPRVLCCVSIDGPEDVHDRIRGVKGSWKNAVATYKRLRMLSGRGFMVFIGYTIYDVNSGLFDAAKANIRQFVSGVNESDFHFNIYHVSDHYYSNSSRAMEIKSVPGYVKHPGKNSPAPGFLTKRYYKHIEDYIKNHRTRMGCASLSSSCFIDPTGNVYPCINYNRRLGNLRELDYDIRKLWNSDYANKTREMIVDRQCPGCWTPCEAYQTILANLLH